MISSFYGVNGKQFQKQYKNILSEFKEWDQREHAADWLLFPDNIGTHLSIDETAFTRGELYTIITNKEGHGNKGCLVAMVKGVQTDEVLDILEKLPLKDRKKVKEVTLDMAGSMNKIVKLAFPKATLVIDRFHVQQLASQALQDMRIKYRWEAIDAENEAMELAKKQNKDYKPELLSNGDSLKKLLARSRYALYKTPSKWTDKQKQRAELLFERYPDIEHAYKLTQELKSVFEHNEDRVIARTKMALWHEKVRQAGFKAFNTISNSMKHHYEKILNFFNNRSTNASAEAFNAKIKAFRSQFRGVTKIDFFLFRLTKLFA